MNKDKEWKKPGEDNMSTKTDKKPSSSKTAFYPN
jgi:hypothetical protein